jgi:hypothetical protein
MPWLSAWSAMVTRTSGIMNSIVNWYGVESDVGRNGEARKESGEQEGEIYILGQVSNSACLGQ